MTLTRDDWLSARGQELVLSYAIHEAGHAVARWWLDRTGFLGRHFVCPDIAITKEGEAIEGGRSQMRGDLGGVVAADPFIMPFGAKITFSEEITTKERRALERRFRQSAISDIIHVMAGPWLRTTSSVAQHVAGRPL